MLVQLYSQPSCGPCTALKSALKAAGVEFDEVDITAEENASAGEFLRDKGYQGTPVVIAFNDEGGIEMQWHGFHIDRVKELAGWYEAFLPR